MKLIERIKTKPGYKFIAFVAIIITPLYLLYLENQKELYKIKNDPNIEVQCLIREKGLVSIDKRKITSINDDVIIFTNGYATNCEIINEGE